MKRDGAHIFIATCTTSLQVCKKMIVQSFAITIFFLNNCSFFFSNSCFCIIFLKFFNHFLLIKIHHFLFLNPYIFELIYYSQKKNSSFDCFSNNISIYNYKKIWTLISNHLVTTRSVLFFCIHTNE